MKFPTFFFLIAAVASAPAQTDDPFANHREPDPNAKPRAAKMIAVLVEYVELEHSKVSQLVRKNAGKRDLTDVRKSLDKLIKSGDASLLESAYSLMRSGQRTTTRSVEERIYATEYDPPEIPQKLGTTGKSSGQTTVPKTPANPTAFESRPVGVVVEFDGSLDASGDEITLFGSCEWTRYLGEYTYVDDDSPHDESKTIKQPKFYTLRTFVTTTVRNGDTVLVATQKPYDDKGKRILVFVRADVVE